MSVLELKYHSPVSHKSQSLINTLFIIPISCISSWAFFTADTSTCQCTCVTKSFNSGCALFQCLIKPWRRASRNNSRTLKLKLLSGIQPSFIYTFAFYNVAWQYVCHENGLRGNGQDIFYSCSHLDSACWLNFDVRNVQPFCLIDGINLSFNKYYRNCLYTIDITIGI